MAASVRIRHISDVVWAALIAGGVGLAGNVTTYLATRHQADAALKAQLRSVEADLDRLRMEQSEPHLHHRQAVYHDFLDGAHRFWEDKTFPGGLFDGPDDPRAWFLDFEHRLSAVRLFGTEAASHAAQDLADYIGALMVHDPLPAEMEERYLELWEATIQAMREDTAPSP